MSKKTLLQMTQNILSSMDSDEVNSISDTTESMQVAEIIRETYEALVATLSLPGHKRLLNLESVSNTDRPNYLRIPDLVKGVEWIKYRNVDVTYLSPIEFINQVLVTAGDLTVIDPGGVTYPVRTDRDPKYWTCFDNEFIAFDSFNKDAESTLQQINTLAYGTLDREFLLEDDFIADLDSDLFPLLQAEAKATCFIDLKQVSNSKEEQKSRQQLVRAQNDLNRTSRGDPKNRLPNYGRNR